MVNSTKPEDPADEISPIILEWIQSRLPSKSQSHQPAHKVKRYKYDAILLDLFQQFTAAVKVTEDRNMAIRPIILSKEDSSNFDETSQKERAKLAKKLN